MMEFITRRWRYLLLWALGLSVGGMLFALLAAYSGIFNIAASAGHPPLLHWFLQMAKERSVKVNSRHIKPPELELAEMVPLGAAHFQGTCAVCHGSPGQPVNPVFEQMLPAPPRSAKTCPTLDARTTVLDCSPWYSIHRHAGMERNRPGR